LLVALGLACVGTQASAQEIYLNAPGLLPKKPPPGAPDVKAPPSVWPRLDPGAVLCRTEADLDRIAANRSGGPGGGPADCRIIRERTGITILQRRGGRSQVQIAGQPPGWTDVWLPEKPPAR